MLELPARSFAASSDDMRAMIKSCDFEVVINRQTVRNNFCSGFDIVPNKRLNCILINRLNATETYPSKFLLCVPFYSNNYQCFALCPTAPRSFFLSAHIGFINFHTSSQMFTSTANHNAPKFPQPTPSRLVTSKSVRVAQILGTQASLLSHHQPHDMKPQTKRFAAVLKNRARRHRTLSLAPLAMPQPSSRAPHLCPTTYRTGKAVGPPNPLQILRTVLLRRKPL